MQQKKLLILTILLAPLISKGEITLTFSQVGANVFVKAVGTITSDFGVKKYYSYGAAIMGINAGYTSTSAWWAEGVHFGYGDNQNTGFDYYYLTNDFVTPSEPTFFEGNTPSSMIGEMLKAPNPSYLNITASFTGSTLYSGGSFSGGLKVEISKDQIHVDSEASYLNTNLSSFFSEQFFGRTYYLHKQSEPQIKLFTLNIIPEPSALSLLAVGLGGLALLRQGRKED